MDALLFVAGVGLLVPLPKGTRNSPKESVFAPRRIQQYGNLPLSFEPNRHQFNQEFDFLGRGPNYSLLLKPDAALLKMSGAREGDNSVQFRFRGGNAGAKMH